MMDYLLEKVLQQQTAEVQAFLLDTAILARLCGRLCDAVMGISESANQRIRNSPHLHLRRSAAQVQVFAHPHAILEYLERANLFIIPLDTDRQWYRYHRLFADLLRQRLQQSTADVAGYHLRASHWYEANGYRAEAFQHAAAAKDFDRAAELAEQAWPSMEDTFQTTAWLGWIKQLPAALIRVAL